MADRLRFYMDEQVPRAVSEGLRRRGVDVLTAQDAGMQPAPDEHHLKLALEQQRVLFTQDTDFLRLHAAGIPHCGLIYAPQQTPVGYMVRGLMLIYEVLNAEDMLNQLEYL